MTLEFKPVDFADITSINVVAPLTVAANIAQKIFNEWLQNQPMVCGMNNRIWSDWSLSDTSHNTHTARIVDVRPIKECEHEPSFHFVENRRQKDGMNIEWRCKKCSQEIVIDRWRTK